MKSIHPHDSTFPVFAPPRRLAAVIALLAMGSARGDTLAYWRFEGDGVASASTGTQVEDSNGRTSTATATGIRAIDSSGNGNTMWAWEHAWAGHTYEPGVPWSVVPQTGAANNYCVVNSGNYPALFTWSSQSIPSGVNLDTWTSSTWTIEASCYTTALGNYRTLVGREGNGVETANAAAAPIYFQMLNNNRFRIMYVDASGVAREAVDGTAMLANQWYHFAATCDGVTLKLYKKTGVSGDYDLVASTDVSTSANPALIAPGNDANGTPWGWTVARGRYGTSDNPADNHGDRWLGGIDEVRISNVALDPSLFLGQPSATPDDLDGDGLPNTWETANGFDPNSDVDDDGADGDPDYDLATNLLEYQNTTNPNLATSYPDSEPDGLNDGWEYYYFENLAQGPDDDPDGDYNSNAVEFAAGSAPDLIGSYPDTENGLGDGMNDGWEIVFLTDGIAALPESDPDGDLSSNIEEFWMNTDPEDPFSSPDSDFDGLADGWEVAYFRMGGEDLASAIAHYAGSDDPDADGVSNKLELIAGTDPASAASAETTLGYWRFEEATAGEVPAGGNGQYFFPTSIQDSSAYGNHMMAWATYSRPNYDAVVPAPTIPTTGATDNASLSFLRNGNGVYYIEAIFSTPTNYLGGGEAILRTHTFNEFTIETSFNTSLANNWQVPISKLGNPVAGQPPFSLKIDTDNKLRAGLVDGSGVAQEIIGTSTIATGSWYSAAVTGDATTMKLWLKKPGDAGYQLEGEKAISGAWYVPGNNIPLDTPWNIGQGMWNGGAGDAFQGNIDEVRISAVVLDTDEFLFHEDATPFQLWAAQNIPDVNQRGEAADPDGDGTSNLAEFMLGLDPMSGASSFAGQIAGSTITWPSAAGLVFSVERSTTLAAGSWSEVASVTATGTSSSWTDLSPPAGKAFYRVVLAE